MKTLVIAAMLLALAACGKNADEPAQPAPAQESKPTGVTFLQLPTLATAITATKPKMEERNDGSPSDGAVMLALWGYEKMRLADIQALPATKWAVVKNDPEAVRGHHICTSGTIVEIGVDRSAGNPIYLGGMYDGAGNIYRFVAVGSTGDLVANSKARFCGVVTNAVSYPNSMGGVGHAVQLVGLFDLPTNKKP
jgi:hypothetical protein